jgi:hypothetical protein
LLIDLGKSLDYNSRMKKNVSTFVVLSDVLPAVANVVKTVLQNQKRSDTVAQSATNHLSEKSNYHQTGQNLLISIVLFPERLIGDF